MQRTTTWLCPWQIAFGMRKCSQGLTRERNDLFSKAANLLVYTGTDAHNDCAVSLSKRYIQDPYMSFKTLLFIYPPKMIFHTLLEYISLNTKSTSASVECGKKRVKIRIHWCQFWPIFRPRTTTYCGMTQPFFLKTTFCHQNYTLNMICMWK